jgi:hypothetical protein
MTTAKANIDATAVNSLPFQGIGPSAKCEDEASHGEPDQQN